MVWAISEGFRDKVHYNALQVDITLLFYFRVLTVENNDLQNFIFWCGDTEILLYNIWVKFVYTGYQVKVKDTGPNTGYTNVTKYTHWRGEGLRL